MMPDSVIPVVTVSAASLWVAALVARPREPRLGNEVEELVYSRLLGRQQRLVILAMFVTALVFFGLVASMPSRTSMARYADSPPQQPCYDWVTQSGPCQGHMP